MRRSPTALATVALLLAPGTLAMLDGGYFDRPRLWAAIAAWAIVALVALTQPSPLPAGRGGRLALAGLVALTAWTALSMLWAPLGGRAVVDVQRGLLYVAGLLAAVALLRPAASRALAEPVLLLGIAAACAVGMAERMLPGVVSLQIVQSAGTRLAQPIGYWNAMGVLGAAGVALAAGLVADPARGRAVRAGSAAAAVACGLALWLSYSRGALGALGAGLAVVVAVAPAPRTLAAVALLVAAAVPPVLVTVVLDGVTAPRGPAGEGAVLLAVTLAAAAAAALATARLPGDGGFRPPLRAASLATLAAALAVSAVGAVNAEQREPPAAGAVAESRLASLSSNRFEYWKVASRTFADHPLAGVGTSGFAVEWLRERPFDESVRDAHSLYLETAAELGIVGLLALALFLAGVAIATRDAIRAEGGAALAAAAGTLAVLAAHAALDWDWELPAIALIAVILAGRAAAGAEGASSG
jgi:hypothetical protein